MNHTITLTIHTSMTTEEIEQWIQEAIETDLQSHLLEGETISLEGVK